MTDTLWAWTVASLPILVIGYLWVAASLSAVFRKAGEEPWQAWVPILNLVVLFRLGGMSGWFLLLALVPVLGQLALIVVSVIVYLRVSRSFGYGVGMTVLAVLLLPVWSSILGWGSARWLGMDIDSASGPVRRRESSPLDERVGASSPAAAYTPAYSPAPLGVAYGVPPKPPAPEQSAPAVSTRSGNPAGTASADGPAAQWSFAPAPHVDTDSERPPVPSLRSTARGTSPRVVDEEDEDDTERPRAPYTQTLPTSVPFAGEPPLATPRSAVPAEPAPIVPAPVTSVPAGPARTSTGDPWAPPAAPVPAAATRALRSAPYEPADGQFDTSAEVSAVAGAPTLGAPRAARESVSAQHGEPEIPDAESAFDETIIAARRRTVWMLTPPLGAPISVTSDVLILGRRPSFDPDFADAQLVPVSDETRTMSKTHARLELQGDAWVVVDLDSTNGVILLREDGSEVDATPGVPERLTERFLLGDAELRLAKAENT